MTPVEAAAVSGSYCPSSLLDPSQRPKAQDCSASPAQTKAHPHFVYPYARGYARDAHGRPVQDDESDADGCANGSGGQKQSRVWDGDAREDAKTDGGSAADPDDVRPFRGGMLMHHQ